MKETEGEGCVEKDRRGGLLKSFAMKGSAAAMMVVSRL